MKYGGVKMDKKCTCCGSSEVIFGKVYSTGGLVFIPEKEKGFIHKSSYIDAYACKKCGEVFGFKLANKPSKLTD